MNQNESYTREAAPSYGLLVGGASQSLTCRALRIIRHFPILRVRQDRLNSFIVQSKAESEGEYSDYPLTMKLVMGTTIRRVHSITFVQLQAIYHMLNYCYSQKVLFFLDGNIIYKQYSIKMGQDKSNKTNLISLEDNSVIDSFMLENLILYDDANSVSLLSFIPSSDRVEGNGQILLHIQGISPLIAKDPAAITRASKAPKAHSIVSRVSFRSGKHSDFVRRDAPGPSRVSVLSSPPTTLPLARQPISPLPRQTARLTSPLPQITPVSPLSPEPQQPSLSQPSLLSRLTPPPQEFQLSPPEPSELLSFSQQSQQPQPFSQQSQQFQLSQQPQPFSQQAQQFQSSQQLQTEASSQPRNSASELNALFSAPAPLQEMATHFTYGNTARSSKPLLRLSELGTERESAFTQNVESEEEWFFQRPADMKPPMKLLSVLSPENSSDESLSSSDTDSNNGDSTSLSLLGNAQHARHGAHRLETLPPTCHEEPRGARSEPRREGHLKLSRLAAHQPGPRVLQRKQPELARDLQRKQLAARRGAARGPAAAPAAGRQERALPVLRVLPHSEHGQRRQPRAAVQPLLLRVLRGGGWCGRVIT